MEDENFGPKGPEEFDRRIEESNPQVEETHLQLNSTRGFWLMAALMLCAAVICLAYVLRERHAARQWATENEELNATLKQTRAQLEALTARLNAVPAAPPAHLAEPQTAVTLPAPLAAPPLAVRATHRRRTVKRAAAERRPVDDPRWKQVQADLAEDKKMIADTRENIDKARADLGAELQSTREGLNTSFARNHEELVALEKQSQRNFYEFDLGKSKEFHPAGSVAISLRKADTKREFCDLKLIVDDTQLTHKHVNLYEPILFYPQGYSHAVELVINKIEKNRAHGYVSEPKYKSSGTAASSEPPPSESPAASLSRRPGK